MIGTLKKIFGLGPKVNYAELVKNGAIIVDVRSPGEYASGNIKGSINIPVDSIGKNLAKLKDKNKVIITCCASGMRSGMAKTMLKNNGYAQVYNAGSWFSLNSKLK